MLYTHFKIWLTSEHVARFGWVPFGDLRGRVRRKTRKNRGKYNGIPHVRMDGDNQTEDTARYERKTTGATHHTNLYVRTSRHILRYAPKAYC